MRKEGLIETIACLRRLERAITDPHLQRDAREARVRVEAFVGPTVKPSVAARLLGVSQPGLRRWLERKQIATVITPSGRREIPLTELIEWMERVERASERAGRPLAHAVRERERERASRTIDVAELDAELASRAHARPELISLLYHRALAQQLTDDIVDAARDQLSRWQQDGAIDTRWVDEWRRILSRPTRRIAETISADTPRLARLRQSSPFAGLLDEAIRRQIVAAVSKRERAR